MEKAEWEKRLSIRQGESESIESSQFRPLRSHQGSLPSTYPLWSQDAKDNWAPGCIYFRRAPCCPVFSSDQRPRLASNCEAPGIKFLCLFVQKLGDIEGQVQCTLLLNSLELGYFSLLDTLSTALPAPKPYSCFDWGYSLADLKFLFLFHCIPFSPGFSSLLHSLLLFSSLILQFYTIFQALKINTIQKPLNLQISCSSNSFLLQIFREPYRSLLFNISSVI